MRGVGSPNFAKRAELRTHNRSQKGAGGVPATLKPELLKPREAAARSVDHQSQTPITRLPPQHSAEGMASVFPTSTTECYVTKHVRNSEILENNCFEYGGADVAGPRCRFAANCILLKVLYIGLEPYMRVFCVTGKEPEWEVGRVPRGKVIGEVLASNVPWITVGMKVKVTAPWRTYTWVEITPRVLVEELDNTVPPELYLGLAGSGGRTARLALEKYAKPQAGQVALVTAAASCVGLAACQLMRMEGVTVLGSCGSEGDVTPKARRQGVQLQDGKCRRGPRAAGTNRPRFFVRQHGGASEDRCNQDYERRRRDPDVRAHRALRRVRRPGGRRRGAREKIIYENCLHDYGQFFVGHFSGDFVACSEHIIRLYKRGRLKNFDTIVDGFHNLGEHSPVFSAGKTWDGPSSGSTTTRARF